MGASFFLLSRPTYELTQDSPNPLGGRGKLFSRGSVGICFDSGVEISVIDVGGECLRDILHQLLQALLPQDVADLLFDVVKRGCFLGVHLVDVVSGGISKNLGDLTRLEIKNRGMSRWQSAAA